jgi:hypothetical protein
MWWAALLNTILGAFSSGVPPITGSFESIATVSGNGSATSLTLSSIPTTYASLQLRVFANDASNTGFQFWVQPNSATPDTRHDIDGLGSSVSVGGFTGGVNMALSRPSSSSFFTAAIYDFHDYASTTKNKTIRYFGGNDTNGGGQINLRSALYISLSAITSLTITCSSGAFGTGSTFALYGIKG